MRLVQLAFPLAFALSLVAVPAPASAACAAPPVVGGTITGISYATASVACVDVAAPPGTAVRAVEATTLCAASTLGPTLCADFTARAEADASGAIGAFADARFVACAADGSGALSACLFPHLSNLQAAPATGQIVVQDDGLGGGPTVTLTGNFAGAFACVTTYAPSVTVSCSPTLVPAGSYWDCPTVHAQATAWQAGGLVGEAHGEASCNAWSTLVTDDVSGAGLPPTDGATGSLGAVGSEVVCAAAGIGGSPAPVAPYRVECHVAGQSGVAVQVG